MSKSELVLAFKHEFECRNASVLFDLFGTFGLSRFRCKDFKKSLKSFATKRKFSTEIFMDQLEPKSTEKHELEKRRV